MKTCHMVRYLIVDKILGEKSMIVKYVGNTVTNAHMPSVETFQNPIKNAVLTSCKSTFQRYVIHLKIV